MRERTLFVLKPDALERSLVGEILSRVERLGLTLAGCRMLRVDRDLCDQHYQAHRERDFYPSLREYILRGPVLALIVEGPAAIDVVRKTVGHTDPSEAAPGTIRGDLGSMSQQIADREGLALENLVHASDGTRSAEREIGLWFPELDRSIGQ